MIDFQFHVFRSSLHVVVALALPLVASSIAEATELLAHYEFECLLDNGCPQSSNMATQARFGVDVYPGRVNFGDYSAGETADVTIPVDQFLVDFLASGSLAAPEPLEFNALMIGAGGGGQSINKSDLQSGFDRAGPPLRIDAGYDVPLANGIDLEGTAILTHLRFQLLNLEIFNSDILPGSTMRSHYRFEFLGQRVPEPSSVLLLGFGIAVWTMRRKRCA